MTVPHKLKLLSLIVSLLPIDLHYRGLELAHSFFPTKGHLSRNQGLQSHLKPLLRQSAVLGDSVQNYMALQLRQATFFQFLLYYGKT